MPSIASRLMDIPATTEAISALLPQPRPPLPSGMWGSQPTPIVSATLRCPLPALAASANPDNLRQYYAGGNIPQYRTPPLNPIK